MLSSNVNLNRFSMVLGAAALLFALGQSSCSVGPLEGDWFECEDAACTVLDDDGIRFTAGDRWGVLDAPGGTYDQGEPYELEQPRGYYDYDGETLSLTLDGSSERMEARLTFDGDIAVIRVLAKQEVCEPSMIKPGEPTAPSTCHIETIDKTTRFKRVGDAGSVPYAPKPENRTSPVAPPQTCGDSIKPESCG
jgi:hypothetical protein